MMEGLNQLGQEEYIWAMRVNSHKAENPTPFRLAAKKSTHSLDTTLKQYQTKVMASLVPDEVINNVDDYSHRKYEACFLFGDVSGFTELCERYTKAGVSGPSRMTQALNNYMGSMVQEVLSHSGDVLKFSGDAFLAMFKSTESESIRDAVHEALDCALVIQKNYGSYLTDVGVIIRVKLAISAGLVTFALIGTSKNSHYVVVGKPIWDVKAAESISSAGDIIVAPAAWHYVNTTEYLYSEMPDNVHMKIVGVGPTWHSVQKNLRQQKPPEEENKSDSESSSESEDTSIVELETTVDEFSLRPAVNSAVRLKIKEQLRRFIIAPVMNSIDKNEPFEYLTEMRQAVIVFINVISDKLETKETVILADQTYKSVCSVVDKMRGCVNKVSLFDKDLMFVVIFGLRGLKHELECQVALKCARQCHTAINNLPGVLSTSIGVTTGKTYCGVFGHTLRREYTVISLIVNKAARLMVAYKGKVTCDKQTFLHSKLEARHFILQEYKPLKGISHPGPVYEFVECEVDHNLVQQINACPLLGRIENLKIYNLLLKSARNATKENEAQYKMLLIKGEARQGKSRLLDELVYTTPKELPVNKFQLTKQDQNVPYQAIRLIFYTPLKISTNEPAKEKEKKLLRTLQNLEFLDLICVFNDVFGVNFKKTDIFLALTRDERELALRKMIKQLAHACFVTFWVLAIDDCEFIDDWSWIVFNAILDINTVFVVATIASENLNKTPISQKNLADPRIKTISLNPIERLYLGALACQILGVYAISPELENTIQTRSNGNPGWIESFLISLIQDEGLYILKATLNQINDLGLVCPPLYMMSRLDVDEIHRWKDVMEEKNSSRDNLGAVNDTWHRYIDSCRDSYLNVTVREEMEAISTDGTVPICVISPNFNVGDEEIELSMDAMILKTFDSLDYFEQLLVKCSAILGNQFPRKMLLYVMSATNQRKAAQAVQKLFEIRVLTCAKGDFTDSGGKVFKEKLIDPMKEVNPECHCRGHKIENECKDLPKYASCGFLQFKSGLFREITYNLLTDYQQKEFHQRAITYLERETRKCKACGHDHFDNILGTKHDKELIIMRAKEKKSPDQWELLSGGHRDSVLSRSGKHSSFAATESLGSVSGSMTSETRRGNLLSKYLRGSYAKEEKVYKNFFGVAMVRKLKDSFSLTRTFSKEDFTDCQCNLILSSTYAQLIEHSMGAGDLAKVIEAMLEYGYLCIITCNIPLAIKTLDEALGVVKIKALEKTENMWKFALIRAKIYILIGYSRLELGHLDQALQHLHLALKEYGIRFPHGFARCVKVYAHKLKQILGFYIFPSTMLKNLDHWETIYANNLSECLSHLCTLHMMRNEWKDAETAATWSLSRSLESFSDFRVICTALANMLQVVQHFSRWNMSIALEVYALRLCHFRRTAVQAEDLKCVAKLYGVIFTSRIHQIHMEKSIHMGYVVLRLCSSVRAVMIILPLLPYFIQILLTQKYFSNVYSTLQELRSFAEGDSDSSGKVWYYALSLCCQIETGYGVIPYNTCENFYQLEGESWITIREPDAKKRFFTVMWLWCMRNEEFEAASVWCSKVTNFFTVSEDDSLTNKITAQYVLEGMLLFLVSKINKRNVSATAATEKEITAFLRAMEQAAQSAKMILPRLYHLKAYYKFIKAYDSKVTDLLNKASRCATKQHNFLELSWIDHSRKAWEKSLSPTILNFWRDHSDSDNMVDFQEIEIGENTGFFTLPTPMFF